MDTNATYLALIVCSGVGLLIIGLAIPLMLGKIKRNQWYGFRTPKTLSSDNIWYPANRTAAINLIVASIFIWAVAAFLYFAKAQMSPQTIVLTMAVLTILALVCAVAGSFIALRKL